MKLHEYAASCINRHLNFSSSSRYSNHSSRILMVPLHYRFVFDSTNSVKEEESENAWESLREWPPSKGPLSFHLPTELSNVSNQRIPHLRKIALGQPRKYNITVYIVTLVTSRAVKSCKCLSLLLLYLPVGNNAIVVFSVISRCYLYDHHKINPRYTHQRMLWI